MTSVQSIVYACNFTHIWQVYLNIVLDDAIEEKPDGEKVRIGMVVIRGNSVVMLEVCSLLHDEEKVANHKIRPWTGSTRMFLRLDDRTHDDPERADV